MKLCCSTCVVSFLAGGLVVGGLLASGGLGQQPGDKKKPAQTPPTSPVKPGEKPGEMPGMPSKEAMKEMAQPGPEHAILKQFEGKWTGRVESFMPGMTDSSTGTMTNSLVLGGRWLKQDWTGEFMKDPFSGIGYWGYDKAKQTWVSTWMDTFSTGVMLSQGGYDPTTKTWTLMSNCTDPAGNESAMRETITVKGPDQHVLEMYSSGMDGKDMLVMRISYTRAK